MATRLDLFESRFDQIESQVQAFLPEEKRFARLRREAAAFSRSGASPASSAVFGLCVGVKDIFRVDGFETHAGSKLPAAVLAGEEAASVQRLRASGALIMGKTVTTEFAYFSPGPTRNPRNLEHTPGGSSSGSAAAIAAGLCDIALGSQTIGSIIRPAAFCGVVGFKPSYDRISRAGVIPLAPALDHVGIFASDVQVIKKVASILCEGWSGAASNFNNPTLGVPVGAYMNCASEEGRAHFSSVCDKLRAAGYELKSIDPFTDFDAIRARHDLILAAQAAAVHRAWFERYGELYSPKTAELVRRGQKITAEQLTAALRDQAALRARVTELMNAMNIDAWIAPAAPGPAPKGLSSTGDPIMNLPWTQAGFPSIGLPAGANDEGLPLGIQLVGNWLADEMLLNFAASIAALVVVP